MTSDKKCGGTGINNTINNGGIEYKKLGAMGSNNSGVRELEEG